MAEGKQGSAREYKGCMTEIADMSLVDKFRELLIADLEGTVECSLSCTI